MSNPWSIGPYEVIALVGKGGMGTVYRARDGRNGRDVAVKVLRSGEATTDPEIRSRFVREIRLARSLNHPNIVTVLDDGEHEGLPYFVMEFLPGETLEDVIKHPEQLPLVTKLQLMEEMCAGLAHAHQANIVHRDVKPANLMVGPDSTLKILDFGIARPQDSKMTMFGVVMGTPNYMSPEQARGDFVDAGTDIFAAGAVLYELITAKKAFPGKGYEEVRTRILSSTPIRLDEACPGIDSRLIDVVEQALEKSRDRRFKSIAVMQSSLAGIRLSLTQAARRSAVGPGGTGIVGTLTPPVGATPRSAADRENIAKQHERHLAIRLAAAEQALKSGDPETAIKSCEQALMLNPADPRAAALLERAYQAVEDRQVEEWIAQARQHVGAGALTEAGRAVEAAAGVNPGHPGVVALQREIAERRRQEAVRAAIGKARGLLEAGDPAAARQELERALSMDARSEEALALGVAIDRVLAVRAGLARAQASSDQGDHVTALREIDQILSQNPAEAEAANAGALKATIARALAAKLERERLTAAVNAARRRFAEGAHDAAIEMLEAIQPASDPLVLAGLEELRRARQAAMERQQAEAERAERLDRQRRVARLIDQARALIETQSFEAAQTRLEAARAVGEPHPEIDILLNRLDQLRRDAAAEAIRQDELRREERQRRRAEAEEERQRRREAAAEARQKQQREPEATLKRVPEPAPEPTLKAPGPEPTLKREEPLATNERPPVLLPLPKPAHPGDHAQRPIIDAHISQAAKFAQRREFRMAIAELEAALAIKPDHVGLNTLIAKMREAEAKRQRDKRPAVPLAEMELRKDRPIAPAPPRAFDFSSLTRRYSPRTLLAGGAIVILVIAGLIWLLTHL